MLITVVSIEDLKYNAREGTELYIKLQTSEYEFDEENFGNFVLDDSFQKWRESQKNMTKTITKTKAQPISINVHFNEEK